MYREDTIAAIATPPGEGGIGIVRISGQQAEEIFKKYFRYKK
jgi:tRNA modification GTPase trmE